VDANIFITGQIGSGVDENGQLVRGVELIDVISQVQSYGEPKEITVSIKSPGGYVEVGDAIYNYLNTLKSKGVKIKTVGDSIVGSIATKIFLVGDERELLEGTEFFIHNPAVDPGLSDANKLSNFAQRVAQVEDNLRKFYAEKTGTAEDVLKPLMDVETSMNPEQAVSLGFATLVSESFPILAKINMSFVDDILKKAKAMAGVKAMQELKLADGKVVVIEAEAGQPVAGALATLDGAPAPDGEHLLESGQVLVISEGKVVEIKEAEAPEEANKEGSEMEAIKAELSNLAKAVQLLMEGLGGTEKKYEEKLQMEITALKSQISSKHVPEKKKVEKFVASKEIKIEDIQKAKAEGRTQDYIALYEKKYGVTPNV
jgi:ATP-dependent protease ClpP protease subunit